MHVVHPQNRMIWDEELVHELQTIPTIPLFHGSDYKCAKKVFFREFLNEPPFSHAVSRSFNDLLVEEKIFSLEASVHKSNVIPDSAKLLYLDKVRELQLRLKLFRCLRAAVVNGVDTYAECSEVVEQLFGRPSAAVFNQLRRKLREQFLKLSFPVIRSYHYQNLVSIFDTIPVSLVPDLDGVSSNSQSDDTVPIVSSSEVQAYITASLHRLGIYDWVVVKNNNPYGNFRVIPKIKTIVVPSTNLLRARKGERRLTKKRLEAMVAHEVHTHVVRSINGLNTPLKLLGIGLSGYLYGEEGIATVREQAVLGAIDYASPNTYFALGIAYGLDRGGKKRSFLETFKILHDYFYTIAGLSGTNSKSKAFAACHRLYRGATGSHTAIILTKDLVYREGNIALYEFLAGHPERVSWFDVGKFDPTNERHVHLLRSLAII